MSATREHQKQLLGPEFRHQPAQAQHDAATNLFKHGGSNSSVPAPVVRVSSKRKYGWRACIPDGSPTPSAAAAGAGVVAASVSSHLHAAAAAAQSMGPAAVVGESSSTKCLHGRICDVPKRAAAMPEIAPAPVLGTQRQGGCRCALPRGSGLRDLAETGGGETAVGNESREVLKPPRGPECVLEGREKGLSCNGSAALAVGGEGGGITGWLERMPLLPVHNSGGFTGLLLGAYLLLVVVLCVGDFVAGWLMGW